MKLDPFQHEDFNFPIDKFEMMLKTNHILFFDLEEFENIAVHYMDSGRLALAKKALKLGLDQHPSATNLRLLKAEVLVLEDQFDKSLDLLLELKVLEPTNDEVLILIASVLSKKDLHHDAIKTLKEALDCTTEAAEVYSILGMEYLFIEDFEQAKQAYISCVNIDKSDYTALYNVIYCYDFLSQRDQAVDFLKQFINDNPYSEIAWHQLGKLYFEDNDLVEALKAFDYAIISDEYFVGAYLEKAKILERLKRYKDAIETYSITLQLEDPTAFAYLRIGKCYYALKQKQKALKYFKQAIHEDPLMDKIWLALSDFYIKEKSFKQALYYINKAISIDEENVLYWKHYAIINQELGDVSKSAYGLKRSLELGNFELETWLSRIDTLIDLKDYQEALMTCDHASDFFLNNVELLFRLSGIYFLLDQTTKSLEFLKKAIAIEADYAVLNQDLFPELFKDQHVLDLLKKHNLSI